MSAPTSIHPLHQNVNIRQFSSLHLNSRYDDNSDTLDEVMLNKYAYLLLMMASHFPPLLAELKSENADIPNQDLSVETIIEFNIPAGPAEESLRHLESVLQMPLLYLVKDVDGVRLNQVIGKMSIHDAIERMTEDTELMIHKNTVVGALVVKKVEAPELPIPDEEDITAHSENPKNDNQMKKNDKPQNGLLSMLLRGMTTLLAATATVGAQNNPEFDEDVIVLDEFVIRPIEAGAEAAIRAQKESLTISNVVSEETMDNLPDQSIGEALSRLPGISIIKDRGEAENITIRGLASRLNAVTINGDRIPSPDSSVDPGQGQRGQSLTAIPATMVSSIEVTKAARADQDADSIGGIVEIKTKRATDLDERIFESQVNIGWNELPEDYLYSGEFTYGTWLGDSKNFGVILGASYEVNNRAVEEVVHNWTREDEVVDAQGNDVDLGRDVWFPSSNQVMWRDLERTRIGSNIAFDWKISEDHYLRAGAFYNEFNDKELRRRFELRFSSSNDFLEEGLVIQDDVAIKGQSDGGRFRMRVRPGQKDTTTYNFFLEGEHQFEDLFVDWRISQIYSSWELYRTRGIWEARITESHIRDQGFARGDGIADLTWDFDSPTDSVFSYSNPTGWGHNASNFEMGNLGTYRIYDDKSEDEVFSAQGNVLRTLEMDKYVIELKAGYKGRWNDRDIRESISPLAGNWRRVRGQGLDDLFADEFFGADRTTPSQPYDLRTVEWADQAVLDQFFLDNTDEFEFRGDDTSDSYFMEEIIQAGYFMATYKQSDFSLIAGLRYEHTSLDNTGFAEVNGDLELATASSDYDNFFPSVILRYQPNENLVWRAAFTQSLGRPDFIDLAPNSDIDFEENIDEETGLVNTSLSITGGDPTLEPFTADNFDIGFEYYFDNGGYFAAGIFHKIIENFEYTESVRQEDVALTDLPEFARPFIPAGVSVVENFFYQRPRNGDESNVTGIELSYQQKFNFLPSPLDNMGIIANYTYVDGESVLTEGLERDFLLGQFDSVANLQLYYEVDTFSARIAWNYNGELYRNIGASVSEGQIIDDPEQDTGLYSEETIDLSFQYRIPYRNSNISLYFDVKNLLDEYSARTFRNSGSVRRIQQFENVGRLFIFGVKFDL